MREVFDTDYCLVRKCFTNRDCTKKELGDIPEHVMRKLAVLMMLPTPDSGERIEIIGVGRVYHYHNTPNEVKYVVYDGTE